MEWDVDAFGFTTPKLNRIVNPSNRRKMGWEDPNNPGQVLSKDAYNALQRQTQAEYEQERSAWRAGNRKWLTKTLPKQIDKGLLNLEKLTTAGTLIAPDSRNKEAMNQWHTPTQVDPATYNLTDKQINRYTFKKGQGFKSQWHLNEAIKEGASLNTDQEKAATNNAKFDTQEVKGERTLQNKSGRVTPEMANQIKSQGGAVEYLIDPTEGNIQEQSRIIPSAKFKDSDTNVFQLQQKEDKSKPKWGKEGTMTKNLQIASAVLEGIQKLQPKNQLV